MPTLAEIREQYPQYKDMSDGDLASALHSKFYKDMPRADFDAKIGFSAEPRSLTDKLLGRGGARHQILPERMVRDVISSIGSAVTLPGDVLAGKAKLPSSGAVPGSVEFGDPESAGARVADLAMLGSPVNPAVRIGDRAIPAMKDAVGAYGPIQSVEGATVTLGREQVPSLATMPMRPKVPTTQELKTRGAADLNAVRGSGLEIKPEVLKNFADTLEQTIGVHPVDAPSTFTKLKGLRDVPAVKAGERPPFVTSSNLMSLREQLGHTAQNFNPQFPKDQLAATRAIAAFDKLIPSLTSKDVLAGSTAGLAEQYARGRGNYAAAMRSNDISGVLDRATTGILERAEGRAEAAHSGRNIDNTIRQKVAAALEKEKEISGLNDAELAALEAVRKGGWVRNRARYIGNMFGGGGGLGQLLVGGAGAGAGAGALAGGPGGAGVGAAIGAIPAVAGAASRGIANQLAKRDLRAVDYLIRQRSPLYQERVANPPRQLTPAEARAALVRALLMSQNQGLQ